DGACHRSFLGFHAGIFVILLVAGRVEPVDRVLDLDDRVALLGELQVALAAGDRAFEGLLLLVGGLGHDQEAQDQSQAQTYLDSCLHRKPPHTWFQSSPRTVGGISSRDGDDYSRTSYSRQSSSWISGEKIFRSSNRPPH